MAGYLNFQTGQVLTAAQVNGFLMEQATMTFADDAARDAALAGVLREGLLTYNLDTNRLEVYDGTDWVEPAPEPPAGIGSNVVNATMTSTFTTSSTSFVPVTGLVATITPSLATSKVLVLLSGRRMTHLDATARVETQLVVDSGATNIPTGDAAVGRSFGLVPFSAAVLHSPGTTSPVEYQIELRRVGDEGTVELFAPARIVLIEVAA